MQNSYIHLQKRMLYSRQQALEKILFKVKNEKETVYGGSDESDL